MLPASGNDLADRACDCLLSLLSPRHVTSSSGPVDRSGAGNTAPCARMPCPSRATWPAGVAIHVCLPCRGHGGRRVSAPNLLTASRDGSTSTSTSTGPRPEAGDGGHCQRAAGKRRGLVRFGPWMLEAPPSRARCMHLHLRQRDRGTHSLPVSPSRFRSRGRESPRRCGQSPLPSSPGERARVGISGHVPPARDEGAHAAWVGFRLPL